MAEKNCGYYRDIIDRLRNGNASDGEIEELLLHCETCPDCFGLVENDSRISGVFEALFVDPPADITEKVMKNIPKKRSLSRFTRIFGGVAAAAVFAFAAFILLKDRVGNDKLTDSGEKSKYSGNVEAEERADEYAYDYSLSPSDADGVKIVDFKNGNYGGSEKQFSSLPESPASIPDKENNVDHNFDGDVPEWYNELRKDEGSEICLPASDSDDPRQSSPFDNDIAAKLEKLINDAFMYLKKTFSR